MGILIIKIYIYIYIYQSVDWVIIGSVNGLCLVQHQTFIWTIADWLLFGQFGTNLVKFESKFETSLLRKWL